jgi:hypothetical protein
VHRSQSSRAVADAPAPAARGLAVAGRRGRPPDRHRRANDGRHFIGAIESRHIHAYMQQQQLSSQQHRDYIHAMLDVVFPAR